VGYLTLDEIPSGRLCRPLFIPDDAMWLALFGGALTELTLAYNYQQFGTLTPQEMADACAEVINQWYEDMCGDCVLPDGQPVLRLGEGGHVEQLINGEWQEPTGDYYLPPPAARTEPTPEERKCLAAWNAANVLKLMYEEITDAYGTGLGNLEAIAAIGTWLAGAVLAALGLAMPALALLALAAWQAGFEIVEFVTADFWTSAFDDNIRCALLRSAIDTDGVVTFDWVKLNNELLFQIDWFDPTAGSFSLAAQVRWMMTQIGIEGVNLAGATTGITSADCDDCVTYWTYIWHFEDDPGNWAILSGQPGSLEECGFETGVVYVGGDPSRGRRQTILQFASFPTDAEVRRITFRQTSTIGVASLGYPNDAIVVNGSIVATGIPANIPTEAVAAGDYTGTYEIQYFLGVGACDGCGDPGGVGCVFEAEISGVGEPPTAFTGGNFI